jgi:hypothetical protein
MEDTIVLRQHYCYMFMLDYKDELTQEVELLDYFDKYNVCNWLGKIEIGDKTGKLHYQMAIWSEHVKTNKQIVAMRKYWTDRLGKATCAIKSARKIVSLNSYCTKEEGKLITNLPQTCLERIPKWVNKSAEKTLWNDKIKDYIETLDVECIDHVKFAILIMDFHALHNKRPSRSGIQYLMWQYNKINSHTLLTQWRLIPDISYWDDIGTFSNIKYN